MANEDYRFEKEENIGINSDYLKKVENGIIDWKKDGLNSLDYELIKHEKFDNYEKILVDV